MPQDLMRPSSAPFGAPFALLLSALLLTACSLFSRPEAVAEEEAPVAPPPAPAPVEPPDCGGGVVKDDGTVETGYGFVPSAIFGIYLQEFSSDEFPSRQMDKVCICWLKTRGGRDIDFEVVFYEAAGNIPAAQPYATVPATASGIADSVESAGAFYEVDVSEVTLAEGTSYIGARWNPSKANFLFVCTNTSEETEKTNVFFNEDRAKGWTSVYDSKDPIFRPHHSILVRATAQPASSDTPASED